MFYFHPTSFTNPNPNPLHPKIILMLYVLLSIPRVMITNNHQRFIHHPRPLHTIPRIALMLYVLLPIHRMMIMNLPFNLLLPDSLSSQNRQEPPQTPAPPHHLCTYVKARLHRAYEFSIELAYGVAWVCNSLLERARSRLRMLSVHIHTVQDTFKEAGLLAQW